MPGSEEQTPGARRGVEERFRKYHEQICRQTDRMFAVLLVAEWVGSVITALIMSPWTWAGSRSSINPHVIAAIFIGFAAAIVPVYYVYAFPARPVTRYIIAVCQILMSILLIDVTGGRIETHFHIFGSLAFLAFYRDWRVLAIASVVTALDHIVRGIWWPQSVYGVLTVSPWRWVEHAWWVAFEDFFLILSCRRNISEMWSVAREQDRLMHDAQHDSLTGLPNRVLLENRFEEHLARARREEQLLAVLFIDLDRFKQLNDAYGHAAGDKLLIEVGRSLREAVAETGTVARIGGDEFLVVLGNIKSVSAAQKVAGKLMKTIQESLRVESGTLSVTASMGISIFPDHGADAESLQFSADHAMYYAKSQGRNKVALFSPAIGDDAYRAAELHRELQHAVSRGELELYYQAQVGCDWKVDGMEALVRWMHPKLGIVPPGEFIPLAEKHGLIEAIGDWVLGEACRQGARWGTDGFQDLKIAINVSPLQLNRGGFAGTVKRALEESGLPPARLEIEITESVLMRDSGKAIRQLEELRRLGVAISIDDFGTGYSSLSNLQQLPVNRLKLDRSFVSQLFQSDRTLPMIETVITMAHQLGLTVIAEGVETAQQCAVLHSIGCDVIQGFLFSKPIPAFQAGDLLESGVARTPSLSALPVLADPNSALEIQPDLILSGSNL